MSVQKTTGVEDKNGADTATDAREAEELRRMAAELEGLRAQLALERAKGRMGTSALEQVSTQNARLRGELDEMHAAQAHLSTQNAQLRAELDGMHAAQEEQDAQARALTLSYQAIADSRSWRMTRPLRATMRLLRRLLRAVRPSG